MSGFAVVIISLIYLVGQYTAIGINRAKDPAVKIQYLPYGIVRFRSLVTLGKYLPFREGYDVEFGKANESSY